MNNWNISQCLKLQAVTKIHPKKTFRCHRVARIRKWPTAITFLAEDVALFSSNKQTIQILHNACSKWAEELGLCCAVANWATLTQSTLGEELILSNQNVEKVLEAEYLRLGKSTDGIQAAKLRLATISKCFNTRRISIK